MRPIEGVRVSSLVSRRNLLRLGAVTGLATTLSPVPWLGETDSDDEPCSEKPCNPYRPETPEKALQALIYGNNRWATLAQKHPGESARRRRCVAKCGQTPFAAILSCSDSRVPPELLFDQGLGDLFVARVAGNGATGTLVEGLYYGRAVLGALVVFVLGHTECGAVKEAVNFYPEHPFEFVQLIFPAVEEARKIVEERGGNPDDPKQVIPVATVQNVILGVKRLRNTPLFGKLVDDGKLLIAGGVYDLATQRVNAVTPPLDDTGNETGDDTGAA